jgi:hypothetical protein
VWGKKRAEATTPLFVNTLDASKFVEITGETTGNWFGESIAGGDFNHDGISDLLIGAPKYSNITGRSYIVWGHNGTWPITINATDIGGPVDGVKIDGNQSGSWSGHSVANAGDVNHDGKTDLIIGAHQTSPPGLSLAGRAYIVFGKGNGTWPTTINLSNLNAADGVIINGAAVNNWLGWSVSGNVDVNGDNTADVIVGAYQADPNSTRNEAGITYVVFGSATLPAIIDTSGSTFFDGTKGFKLFGEKADDQSGYSVSSASDMNGDGIGDIIIGARHWDLDETATNAGRSYVVFGHRGAWPAVVELSSLNGKNGFTISGNLKNENSGYSVSGAGDINNDGLSDIIVGAPYWNSNPGRAVVVYGSFFAINCKTADTITGKCQECDSGHGLSNDIPGTCELCSVGTQWNTPPGQGCVNCTLGNGCHACDMTSGDCTLCPDDRWIDGTGCKTCDAPCVSCNVTSKACTSCPSKMKISGTGCVNCTLGNGCLACDMTSGDCTSCPGDRWIDGTGCKTCDSPCVSCNVTTKACTSCPSGWLDVGTGCVDGGVIVVIEIDGDATAEDLKKEIQDRLGIQVTVIEIIKGVFEITVTDDTIATNLVDMVSNVCRSH